MMRMMMMMMLLFERVVHASALLNKVRISTAVSAVPLRTRYPLHLDTASPGEDCDEVQRMSEGRRKKKSYPLSANGTTTKEGPSNVAAQDECCSSLDGCGLRYAVMAPCRRHCRCRCYFLLLMRKKEDNLRQLRCYAAQTPSWIRQCGAPQEEASASGAQSQGGRGRRLVFG
jgi:hypothetical protein